MSKIENKIYEYNAQPKEKKYLKYNGKEYLINTGYKTLKKTTKLLSKIDNLEDIGGKQKYIEADYFKEYLSLNLAFLINNLKYFLHNHKFFYFFS